MTCFFKASRKKCKLDRIIIVWPVPTAIWLLSIFIIFSIVERLVALAADKVFLVVVAIAGWDHIPPGNEFLAMPTDLGHLGHITGVTEKLFRVCHAMKLLVLAMQWCF